MSDGSVGVPTDGSCLVTIAKGGTVKVKGGKRNMDEYFLAVEEFVRPAMRKLAAPESTAASTAEDLIGGEPATAA